MLEKFAASLFFIGFIVVAGFIENLVWPGILAGLGLCLIALVIGLLKEGGDHHD